MAKIYERIVNGVVTNRWTAELGDESYNEPSWAETQYSINIIEVEDPRLIQLRADRNEKLSDCDWTQLPDAPLSEEQKELWQEYRQALRDLPETVSDLNNIVWPTKPGV